MAGVNKTKYAIRYYKPVFKTLPSLTDLKSLVDNKEFYYQLATPQTITLTNTKIKLFEGTNIFKLTSNLDTDFEIEYYKKS